jgi:hypothetical protein
MRALAVLSVCLSMAVALAAVAKPAKKKAKPPSGEAFARVVFAGELFASGNLYLYPVTEKPGPWPKEVSYFIVDQVMPTAPVVSRAQLDQVVKHTTLSVLEDGKSTAIVGTNTVGDFARYRGAKPPAMTAVVIAVSSFELEAVTISPSDVPRPTTPPEKKAADNWYADWKKEYRKLNGEEYAEEKDEMFGRPETLADAKVVATLTFKGPALSVRVSRWNSRSAAHIGVAWFVVDVMLGDKILKTMKAGIPTGPLG